MRNELFEWKQEEERKVRKVWTRAGRKDSSFRLQFSCSVQDVRFLEIEFPRLWDCNQRNRELCKALRDVDCLLFLCLELFEIGPSDSLEGTESSENLSR